MNEITVIKCDPFGHEVFRWKAKILERWETEIQVEARFQLENHSMGEIPLEPGDRFVETYSTQHWYNIFEVYSNKDDRLKCWYCNLSYPAEIIQGQITFRDLALDLLIHPNGRQEILDEEEFQVLDIPKADREKALTELEELQAEFRRRLAK